MSLRILFGGALALLCLDAAPSMAQSPTAANDRLSRALEVIYQRASAQTTPVHVLARVVYPSAGIDWSGAIGSTGGADRAPAKADQTFRIASVTKTFTATAVMKLVEQKRLSLETPIGKLLGKESLKLLEAAGAQTNTITLRDLLVHRSGLFDYANTPQYVDAVGRQPKKRWTRQEQLRLALAAQAPVPAGAAYEYSDTNYILLGEILERATKKPLAAALRDTIDYRGIGLRSTYLESLEPVPAGAAPRLHQFILGSDTYDVDPSFDLWGGGGLVSTTQDLTTFYRALFKGKIVSPKTLATMTQTVSGGGFAEEAYTLGLMPFYIGNTQCYGHTGLSGVIAAHCPEIDYTFAVEAGDLYPGISLDASRRGPGARLARAIGISTTPQPLGWRLRRTACPPELNNDNAAVHCGMLNVPENYADLNGRTIELAVAYAQHTQHPANLQPLLFLGGGPGVPLLPTVPPLLSEPDLANALLDGQDAVFIEQRGVGASRPSLNCETPISDPESAVRCRGFLQSQGIALDQYNSIASASDMEVLRRQLRVSQWNLVGFSYGTRLALSMYRERPWTVNSLTLDGVFTPDYGTEREAVDFGKTLRELLANCAVDRVCNASFPNLKTRLFTTLQALDRSPLIIDGKSIDGKALVRTLTLFQTSPELLAYLPAVMDAYARADRDFIAKLLASPSVPAADTDATGMFYSVVCNEELPFISFPVLERLAASSDPLVASIAQNGRALPTICQQWPSGRAPAREGLPVRVHAPTLVFNEQYDLQTPPQGGRAFVLMQNNARAVEFPGIGHVATQQATACAIGLLAQFQRGGDPRKIDASCATAAPPIAWKPAIDQAFYEVFGIGG